jgi:TetR/AcrR family transcriptional regulator
MVQEVQALGLAPEPQVRELVLRILREYAHAQHAHRVLTDDVRFLQPEDSARILDLQRRVTAGFAGAIAAWRPELDAAGLVKPLTMLLFGMINWMFTWLNPDGELTHEDMATIVADLLAGGVPAVRVPSAAGADADADTDHKTKSNKTARAGARRRAGAAVISTEGDNA